MAKDCAFFGLEPPASVAPAQALWAAHLAPMNAFLAVGDQWRTAPVGYGFRIMGLDYGAVHAGLALAEIDLTPAEWADFRVIERAAKAALNGE